MKNFIKDMEYFNYDSIKTALGFLTRLPVKDNEIKSDSHFGKSINNSILVGIIIGVLLALVYFVGLLFSGRLLSSTIVVVMYIIITGGLHLDGLGDTFDGIFSNRDKARMLEIMKDSSVGTFALLAIVGYFFLMVVSINDLIWLDAIRAAILFPVAGRYIMYYNFCKYDYARKEGMGKLFFEYADKENFKTITGIVLILFFVISIKMLIPFGIAFGLNVLFSNYISSKIDGLTGDSIGATLEVTQVVFLLFCGLLF